MPEKRPAQDGAMVLAPAKKQRNEMVIVNNMSKQLMEVSLFLFDVPLIILCVRRVLPGAPTWRRPSCC